MLILLLIIITIIMIITHIKRDSRDCNGNEKDNSEKELEGKSKTFWVIY